MNDKVICYNCNSTLELESGEKISREDLCPSCHYYIHCCQMCKFYDETIYNECREPNAERILDKEKANFCDYYELHHNKKTNIKDEQLSLAASLFKK